MTSKTDVRREEANQQAANAMIHSEPVWVDVKPAIDVIPDMREDLILHAGPPITWDRMIDGQKGAMLCAAQFEGLADTPEEAEEMFAAGDIKLGAAHDHNAVGPGSGATSANMPVFVVRDERTGKEGYCTIAEMLMVFGCYGEDAVNGIHRLQDEIAPMLKAAVDELDGLPVKPLLAKSLFMGDEGHDRTTAGSNLLGVELAPALLRAGKEQEQVAQFFEYVSETDLLFFTFLNMAAAKAMSRAAEDIEHSSVATVLAPNGVEFGIKVSGLDDEWFTAPAPHLDGNFFGDYTQADASPAQGDSIVTDAVGLGGFSLPASPAHVRDVGGTMEQATRVADEMQEITVAENLELEIPNLDFRGTPTGVDIHEVIETGVTPFHASGLGHKERGEGFIGFGIGHAPLLPFLKAREAYVERYDT